METLIDVKAYMDKRIQLGYAKEAKQFLTDEELESVIANPK